MEARYYDMDIKCVEKAIDIIREWNNRKCVDKVVQLNRAEVWNFRDDASDAWAGRKVLQEPFIHNWEKFNSNTGWKSDKTGWAHVMQALSHFSYHVSGGQFVLCDLQGGIYRHGAVLTDPVIISRQKGRYGVTDLGPGGISSFFGQHECNNFCRSEWQTPKDCRLVYRPTKGTSMENAHAPTRASRPRMSACREEEEEEEESSDDYY